MKDTSMLSAQMAAVMLEIYLFNVYLQSTYDMADPGLSASEILTYLIFITLRQILFFLPSDRCGNEGIALHLLKVTWSISGWLYSSSHQPLGFLSMGKARTHVTRNMSKCFQPGLVEREQGSFQWVKGSRAVPPQIPFYKDRDILPLCCPIQQPLACVY